jgi:hypothetical protein
MTLPTATVPTPGTSAPAPDVPVARRHAGCYWDVERAAWVRFTRLPLPRDPRG